MKAILILFTVTLLTLTGATRNRLTPVPEVALIVAAPEQMEARRILHKLQEPTPQAVQIAHLSKR